MCASVTHAGTMLTVALYVSPFFNIVLIGKAADPLVFTSCIFGVIWQIGEKSMSPSQHRRRLLLNNVPDTGI